MRSRLNERSLGSGGARVRLLVALAAVLLLVLTACGGSSESGGGSSDKPFRVGALLSLSGPGASLGDDYVTGLEMARDAINADGGIMGRQIKLTVRDDEGDPTRAAREALQLVDSDGVDAVVGPFLSAASGTALPVISGAGLLHIGMSFSPAEGDAAKNPFTFRAEVSAALVGPTFPAYASEAKLPKIGIIATDDARGVGIADSVEAAVKKTYTDTKVVGRELMQTGAPDVTPQLEALRRSDADVLVLGIASEPDFLAVMRGVEVIGWNDVVVLGTAALAFEPVIKGAPPSVLKRSFAGTFYKRLTTECVTDKVKEFQELLRKKAYGGGKITAALQGPTTGWDALHLLKFGIEGAKSFKPADVRDYLQANRYDGVKAVYVFTQERHDGVTLDDMVFVEAVAPVDGLGVLAPGQSC